MKVLKIGLKVWSTNQRYLDSVRELKKEGFFDYIELFVEPDSLVEHLDMWKDINAPFLLHAPHSYAGLNFADKGCEQQNRALIKKVDLFEKGLHPKKVIFHPGINGLVEETIRQMKMFYREFPDVFSKAVIENKPKIGLRDEPCVGASYGEISKIMEETGHGFCFDIGHALCFAHSVGRPWKDVITEMLTLGPEVFHLSDGDMDTPYDRHCHLGKGNYPLDEILSMIPESSLLSLETPRDSKDCLDDFKEDVNYLKACLSRQDQKKSVGNRCAL